MPDAQNLYRKQFNETATHLVRAPGRLELLGNHTDYNEGLVMAIAVDRYIQIASSPRADGKIDVVATAWAKGDRVVWFENPGDPRGKWKRHVIKDKWFAANQVIVADLNGDKRPDIIATAERGANELRWWRNEGKGR